MREFDLFVIGGGSGGVRAARIAAQHGARVAMAEHDRIGGTCVIRGCVPKKLMVYASRFAGEFSEAAGYGWSAGKPDFDWTALKANRDREIARLEGVYETNLRKAGVTLLKNRATLADAQTVELASNGERIAARTILVASGAKPSVERDVPGAELIEVSDDLFVWPQLPPRVLIHGGGYIAVEFACLLNGLGSRVTLVIRGDRILRGFDEDLRSRLHEQLIADGIDVVAGATVTAIARAGEAKCVSLSNASTVTVDTVLYGTGREPNTAGLGLEAAGVELNGNGAVVVDAQSRSNVPSVYAIGDVTDRVNLTPVAIRDAQAFADCVYGGKPTAVDYAFVPTAIFSTPELATLGCTEEKALKEHPRLDVYRADFRPLKATLSGHPHRTLMKLLVDRDSDRVVGCHMLGEGAAEMMQLLALALRMGASKADFDATMALHPTAAEEWVTLRMPATRHNA